MPRTLGNSQFCYLFHRAMHAAVCLAPCAFRADAIYDRLAGPDANQRTGTEFRFADKITAMQFRLCYDAALRGCRCPSLP